MFLYYIRIDEEAAARAKLDKSNRELATQLQETIDDLESEREARGKSEKMKKQLNEELDKLQEMLEETTSSTTTQKEIRAQRESELAALKKTLEEEITSHEETISSMRQKHSRAVEDLNEQLENARKVCMYLYYLV